MYLPVPSPGMEAIQLDGDILFGLLRRVAPRVHRHLKSQGVEPILYMTEWFLCIFSRTLPWPSVLRWWDTRYPYIYIISREYLYYLHITGSGTCSSVRGSRCSSGWPSSSSSRRCLARSMNINIFTVTKIIGKHLQLGKYIR